MIINVITVASSTTNYDKKTTNVFARVHPTMNTVTVMQKFQNVFFKVNFDLYVDARVCKKYIHVYVALLYSSLVPKICLMHYGNTPMQYTAIFHGCKNDNYQMKNVIFFSFFAQNIDRGYTLEPPQ